MKGKKQRIRVPASFIIMKSHNKNFTYIERQPHQYEPKNNLESQADKNMFCPRLSLVFLPIYIYFSCPVYLSISSDYTVLSAASAYTEKDSRQEEISGDRNYSADHTAHDRNFMGGYDTGR